MGITVIGGRRPTIEEEEWLLLNHFKVVLIVGDRLGKGKGVIYPEGA